MNTELMFSSKDMTWATPQDFFNRLNEEFRFNLDVCALPQTAKCINYYTPETNSLTKDWRGVCFMNPPYGREIGIWIQKAYYEGLKGSTIVCLIPARTDTRYFQEYCMRAKEIRFIKGRLKFGDGPNPAPFPSALVIFQGYHEYPQISEY